MREVAALLNGKADEGEIRKAVLALLNEERLEQLEEVVQKGIDLNFGAFRKSRWLAENKSKGAARGNAVALDHKINDAVAGLYELMSGKCRGVDEDDEDAPLAKEVLEKGYPSGTAAIIQVDFDLQVSTVDDFLARFSPGNPDAGLREGPLFHVVNPLDIGKRLGRIEQLNREFEAELRTSSATVTQTDVDQAKQKGLQALHRVFIRILSDLDGDTVAHINTRSRLIAPILYQDQRVAEANRRTRRVQDINPDTGLEEGTEPTEPTTSSPGEPPATTEPT